MTSREVGQAGRGAVRGIPRKSGAMYVYITDFSLQYQGRKKTGTELGMDRPAVRRCRTHRLAVAVVTQNGGLGRWSDVPSPTALAPVPASWAAAARERPRSRRMPRCLPIATAPGASLRSATRAPGRCVTQRWHTPALGALASSTHRPCQGKRMPPYSWRPALGGRREYGGHTPSWQGRAVRGGSPRGGVSLGLAALDLSNRPGLRVPATPSVRGPERSR